MNIFCPRRASTFTDRHRAVFFEVVTEIYERTLGVNADYEIVLDRPTLTEIIVDALDKNRSLIFSAEDGDEELDGAGDDREYADKVRRRLKLFGVIEEYNDTAYLKVLWRFTPEGKRIAKMFADTRRKTSVARQRSVRACKGALKAFSEEGNHEYLVDAYEYASTIFDDVCQVSDLFTEHQRRIMGHSFSTSKEALVGYMLGVNDFDKRASRYFDSDNIYNHASDIVDLTESIASMNPAVLEAADRKMMEEHPALEEEANGERLHTWMLARIRRVVESTRDIKHEELHRVVGEFSTNYAILIGRLIKLSAVGTDDPLIRFAGMFAAAGDEERDKICREMLHHLFPQRADLIDPADLKISGSFALGELPMYWASRRLMRFASEQRFGYGRCVGSTESQRLAAIFSRQREGSTGITSPKRSRCLEERSHSFGCGMMRDTEFHIRNGRLFKLIAQY